MAQAPGVPINGRTLRTIRELRGMTQEQLAEMVGVDPSAISNYERGVIRPPVARLDQIRTALDVPLDSLDCTDLIERVVLQSLGVTLGKRDIELDGGTS